MVNMNLGLDIRTLCLMVVFLSGIYCIGLIIKQNQRSRTSGVWSLFSAIFFFMIGFSLLSFGNDLTPWLSKITANLSIAFGFSLIVLSLIKLRNASFHYFALTIFGLCLTATSLLYYTFTIPSTNARVIIMSVYVTLCTLVSILVIRTGTTKDVQSALWLLISVLGIHSLFMIYRIWFTLNEEAIGNFLYAGSIHQFAIIITAVLVAALGFCYTWILNARQMHSLYSSSLKDSLTQVYNRGAMTEMMPRELARCKRHGFPLSLIILDIDHFKRVNDQYGHQTGDRVLNTIGRLLSNELRAHDLVFRYGGEEFVIVLPDTPFENASLVAEKLRVSIGKQLFWRKQPHPITASFGVAHLQPDDSLAQIIKRADIALYYAKEHGRNTIGCLGQNHSDDSEMNDTYLLPPSSN